MATVLECSQFVGVAWGGVLSVVTALLSCRFVNTVAGSKFVVILLDL